MNKVIIAGRLGDDPDVSYSQAGTCICRLRIATNDYFAKEKVTNWHTVKLFGKKAEVVAEHFGKGGFICVSGFLSENKWEDREGNKRRDVEIIADDFDFGDKATGGGGRPAPRREPEPEPQQEDLDDDIPFS